MLRAFEGYFDGSCIVLAEDIALQTGQKVTITADVAVSPVKNYY